MNSQYKFDAKDGLGVVWYSRLDINNDGLVDLIYYANSLRSWSSNIEIPPVSFLQVLVQQMDKSFVNETSKYIASPISPLMGVDLSLGDFNGDGVLDFVLGGSGWDPYVNGKPADFIWDMGEPNVFYLSQEGGHWLSSILIEKKVWTHNVAAGDIDNDGFDDLFSSSIEYGLLDKFDPDRSFFTTFNEYGAIYNQDRLPDWLSGKSRWQTYESEDGRTLGSSDIYTGATLFDANGDGYKDLALLPIQTGRYPLLLLNDGFGAFDKFMPLELPAGPYGAGGVDNTRGWMESSGSIMLEAVSADIDNDGDYDLVTLSTSMNGSDGVFHYYSGAKLQVLANTGEGNFIVRQEIDLIPFGVMNYNYHHSIEFYDINRDGLPDIITQHQHHYSDSFKTEIFINNGRLFERATEDLVPSRDKNYIPIHLNGELAFIEFYNEVYALDPRDGVPLGYTNFQIIDIDNFISHNTVSGSVAAENKIGSEKNDRFIWSGGTDVIDGLGGIDELVLLDRIGSSIIQVIDDNFTIRMAGDRAVLKNVERVKGSDFSLALDLHPSEHAGQAVLFIGVLAPNFIASPDIVGLILGFVDGGMNMQQLNQLAFDIGLVHDLAGGSSNADVARMAFENVVGAPATPDMIDLLVSYMDGRSASFTQPEFLTVVANLEVNQVNVDLVGLAQTGIEYAVG